MTLKIGDEIHFLTECVSYLELRNILFAGIRKEIPKFLILSNKEKNISILTEQNINVAYCFRWQNLLFKHGVAY